MSQDLRVVAGREAIRVLRGTDLILAYNLPHAGAPAAWRTNFIHPLAAPSGACITDDAPADHAHHRGIFWAWRRVLIADETVDSWAGNGFSIDVVDRNEAVEAGSVVIDARMHWLAHETQRIVAERTRIRVSEDAAARHLEITIALRALVPGIALAGTDDAKAYGGPAIRFAQAGLIESESERRRLEPASGAVETGATVDFSWRARPPGYPRRVRASCTVDGKPWTQWILRREPGMQNAAFPGNAPRALSQTRDLVIQLALRLES